MLTAAAGGKLVVDPASAQAIDESAVHEHELRTGSVLAPKAMLPATAAAAIFFKGAVMVFSGFQVGR